MAFLYRNVCTGTGRELAGAYEKDALDIGLGMNPELTGRGNGSLFFHSYWDTLRANSANFHIV